MKKIKATKFDTTDFNRLVDSINFEEMIEALYLSSKEHRRWHKNSIPRNVLLKCIAIYVESVTGEKIQPTEIEGQSFNRNFKIFTGTNAEKLAELLIDLEQLKIVHYNDTGPAGSGWDRPIAHFEFLSHSRH